MDESPKTCALNGCDEVRRLRRGYCNRHYRRLLKTGDPTKTKRWINVGQRCSVDGCANQATMRGWCQAHYTRWSKHGDVLAHVPIARKIPRPAACTTGCGNPVLARGLCAMHYQRWKTTGQIGSAQRRNRKYDPDATEKSCSKCGQVKGLEDFPRDPRLAEGRAAHCKECAARDARVRRMKRKYGLTPDEFADMLADQGGTCGICLQPPDERGLVVDHCHLTGHVRGLLCNNCNSLLGMAGDNVETLRAAIRYLEMSLNE